MPRRKPEISHVLKGSNYYTEVTVKLLDNIHSILPALSLRGHEGMGLR